MKILCVDDDRATLTLVTRTLEKACPSDEILAAPSGEKAVDMLRAQPIDLIVSDLIMPGISGMEVLEEAKQERPETEVIIVTAYSSVESAVKAMQKGARDYLPKPINTSMLIEKVENQRTLLLSRREIDNYHYAMSVIEEDISRTARSVERRVAALQNRLDRITELAAGEGDPQGKLEKIRACLHEPALQESR
jgi:DNA-binding NtrC family response regulator